MSNDNDNDSNRIANYDYYDYYNDINNYRENFIKKIKDINALLAILQDNTKISDNVKLEARIKSYKSFYRNLKSGKNVDDCFGIRVISGAEDLDVIKNRFLDIFDVKCLKDHSKNKDTKYNAIHFTVMPKKEDESLSHLTPLIELQLYTTQQENENKKGLLAHDIYKLQENEKETLAQAQLGVLREFDRIIGLEGQELAMELPEYYEMNGDNVEMLSQRDTIRKMFPTIFKEKGNEDKEKVDNDDKEAEER